MFNQNPPFQISHNVCEKNAGNNFFHKLKLIVQTLPEQEIQVSICQRGGQGELAVSVQFRFLYSAFFVARGQHLPSE